MNAYANVHLMYRRALGKSDCDLQFEVISSENAENVRRYNNKKMEKIHGSRALVAFNGRARSAGNFIPIAM